MDHFDKKFPAVILGMFETGLGVARSLGRLGIPCFGMDYKEDLGFHSRFIRPVRCPHPLDDEEGFVSHLVRFSCRFSVRPVLFVTADDFLITVSSRREELQDHYRFNLPDHRFISSISDKSLQYELVQKAGIRAPETVCLQSLDEVPEQTSAMRFPLFIKAREVNAWRTVFGGKIKGFVVRSEKDLLERCREILGQGVHVIAQELIPGTDTNHYKVNCYFTEKSKPLLAFTLRKIRQNPIRHGVGSVVESIAWPELLETGLRLFQNLHYQGVGSAEFKLDPRDRTLKLIEINPRYWQQNALADRCGMNFPLMNYLDVTGQAPEPVASFETGVKWINIYMDFDSFLAYRRVKEINFMQWLKSLRGKKILSDFSLDDPRPALAEMDFGKKIFRLPAYLLKRIR
jgi:D-aspartate ligase